ncbi:uroporphyrinogen-III synthase [Paracoccus sp. S4493]|uniref:uroporphyrinogen-III synthase n=2 Tax=Paracoccaceae TaxID=31989 RepID=UPI0005F9B75D|nr:MULTISPECIES: uroporphyrinogen-III synthase [unclassified Paracoccus (in: a-proteobacteria)]AZY94954.1 uroporphyrinogen-III synthase [Paracoccus sp. Arc7-R13]KJZ30618.1 uroporphyrinogen-III synthase [Paracoccus sp. S4493]
MPPAPRPILLMTRPGDDSERTAARIGADVIVAPILQIVPVDHDGAALARAPGLVFTSAHAVASAGPGRGRPAICVGERTGQVARDAGFAVIQGAGTADSLVPLIAASPVPLVHPHGRHLAQRLAVPGIVVYDQRPQPLTARARAALMGARPVVVPVYSPRSARLLAGMAAGARAPLWLVAISDAAAAAWTAPAARRAVADQPSGRAMDAAIRAMLAAEQS